ncbi:MAG TPA: FAD-dependent oxidoreductase, partial [Anaerolineae bacterium]|nr:FAD-dependent oxidoreductase [Anaerolineae bacterium]
AMIARGQIHSSGPKLAAYLTTGKEGERAELVELRGVLAEDIRGAFADLLPGQYGQLYPHIAAPEGRFHFAGEHASLNHAWMQGAIHSGIRAAIEIHSRVG